MRIEQDDYIPYTSLTWIDGQLRRTNFVQNDGAGWQYEYTDDPLERLLEVRFCDSTPFPPIGQYQLLRNIADSVTKILPQPTGDYYPNVRFFINGSAGFHFSGIPYMWNDGQYTGTHNVYENDADIFVALPGEDMFRRLAEGAAIQLLEEDAIPFSHETYLHGKAPRHRRYSASKYSRIKYEWSHSPWFPSYLKVFLKYYRHEIHSIDLHHLSAADYHQEMIRRFVPCYSTVVGYPLYEGFIAPTGEITHTIWQQFRLEPGQHRVKLTDPSNFAVDETSLIKLPRIPLFATQISVAAHEAAVVDDEVIEVMKEVVQRAKKTFTERRRTSSQSRYATCRHRACLSQKINENDWMEYIDRRTHGVSARYLDYVLDKVGWSDLVFGKKLIT